MSDGTNPAPTIRRIVEDAFEERTPHGVFRGAGIRRVREPVPPAPEPAPTAAEPEAEAADA